MANEKLVVELRGDAASLMASLKAAGVEVQKFEQKAKSAGSGIADVFVGNLASQAVSTLSSLLVDGGRAVLDYSANLETVTLGFERLEGGSANAQKQIERLQKFSKDTPLTFEGLLPTAQRFEEIGFKGEKLFPVLRDIGNIVAGGVSKSGESLDQRLERVGVAIKQIADKGRVQKEELDQLSEAGVNGLEILSKELNKSKAETLKLVEEGKVNFEVFLAAFQRFSQANFGDAMEKQSRTFNGAVSSITDSIMIASNVAFQPLYKEIAGLSVRAAKDIEAQGSDFKGVGSTVGEYVVAGFTVAIEAGIKAAISNTLNRIKNDPANTIGILMDPLDIGGMIGRGIFRGVTTKGSADFVQYAKNLMGVEAPKTVAKAAEDLNKLLGKGTAKKSGASKKSPVQEATEDAKRLEEQLRKTIAAVKNENSALLNNVEAREADNLQAELQLKNYDKLIPNRFRHIVALQREADAMQEQIDKIKELSDGYKSATEKYEDWTKTQLRGIAEARGETNEFADALQDLEENVFSSISKAQEFQIKDYGASETALRFNALGNEIAGAERQLQGLIDTGKSWTSSSLAAFVKGEGFRPGHGFAKRGHNVGSKHYSGQALDVPIAVNDVERLVRLAEASIKAGIRFRDERVRPPGQKVWGGSHAHLEENDNRPSYFNPKLNYGGKLDYLRELDAQRLAGKFKEGSQAANEFKTELGDVNREVQTFGGFSVDAEKAQAKWLVGQKALAEITARYSSELADLNGVTTSAVAEVDRMADAAANAGIELDKTALSIARGTAFLLDFNKSEKVMNDLTETEVQNRIAARDAIYEQAQAQQDLNNAIRESIGLQAQDNLGIKMPRRSSTDIEEKSPRLKRKRSAFEIADAGEGDFKKGGIMDPDTVNTQVDLFKTMGDAGMEAFRGISAEIANAAANWIAYGDASGQSLQEVTAQVLASVSAQALAQGLMELGIGIAALTPWGAAVYGPAPIHFKSAGVLLGIGAGFGGLARAAGGGSGGGSSSGKSSSNSKPFDPYADQKKSEKTNFVRDDRFLRESSNPVERMLQDSINRLADRVGGLDNKIGSMSAGDVLVAGTNQKKGFLAKTVETELSKNSTLATKTGRTLGMK